MHKYLRIESSNGTDEQRLLIFSLLSFIYCCLIAFFKLILYCADFFLLLVLLLRFQEMKKQRVDDKYLTQSTVFIFDKM